MPDNNATIRTMDVSPGQSPEQSERTLAMACAFAVSLVRQLYEHASPETDEAQLDALTDRMEVAVVRVVRHPATTFADFASKYELQTALRTYRALTIDLMAALGSSIEADLAALDAAKSSNQTPTSSVTLLERVLSGRKARNDVHHALARLRTRIRGVVRADAL